MLAFRMAFKLPLQHPIVEEFTRHTNISPHLVIPNAWKVLAEVLSLNAGLNMEIGVEELLFPYAYKTFEKGNVSAVLHSADQCLVEELPRYSKKEW